jgi:NAD(P)-dependent dehydrogenase (short-subunit alcohol dehydrogenase family)
MPGKDITPRIDFPRELSGLFDLKGKVAYVPGGYGGIGEAIAWALAIAGARVAVSGRDPRQAEALAGRLAGAGHPALGLAMDAHSVADIRASVDAVVAQWGRLDILVNCVGMQREQPLLEVTEEVFDEVLAVNLKAAMFLSQAAARHQIAGGSGGAQMHLLSVRAQLGLRGRGYSAYCATKGGLVMLIRQHASELAPHGITVNGIAPTVVRTEMARHWLENPETHAQVLARIPLGRVAEPKDIAGAALFFASPGAAFITGQVLYLDGGITASQ